MNISNATMTNPDITKKGSREANIMESMINPESRDANK